MLLVLFFIIDLILLAFKMMQIKIKFYLISNYVLLLRFYVRFCSTFDSLM